MPTTDQDLPAKTTLLLPSVAVIQPYIQRGASPELAACLFWFNRHMEQQKLPVLVYCIYRSNESQARLYAQGRTAPGHIVTNAKPGQSLHNRTKDGQPASDAFDACPIIDGKPSWLTTGPALHVWQQMGNTAQNLGLIWGRNFKSLAGDWAHFQYQRPPTNQKGNSI